MQIEITEIEPCKLKVTYEADAEQILNKKAEIISIFKKAPVPGFRPGKATIDIIKHHYRDQINDSLKKGLAEDAFHNTLFEKKLKPHGAPSFNSLLLIDGKFSCEFNLHTKPEFEITEYKNFEIPKPFEAESTTDICEKMLQELRVRYGEVSVYADGDVVENGDNVIINYEGFVDGQKQDNLSAEGEMLCIGNSQLPSFDDNLIGMPLGGVREFDVVVPETGLPSLAGKTVHFIVTVSIGSKTVPCALDDSLAVKMGKKDISELRGLVLGSAQAQLANKSRSALTEAICQRLINNADVSVPHWMSLSEAQYLVHSSKIEWGTLSDADKEKYIELGARNVKISLILDKIRELEPEAQLTDQEVFDAIKNNLAHTKIKTSIDDVIKEMNRTGYLQILFSRMRDEHTLDFLVKNTKIIE